MTPYKDEDEAMETSVIIGLVLLAAICLTFLVMVLQGCNIRAVAMLETSDAVYGKTEIRKSENYYPPAATPTITPLPPSPVTGLYGVTP